MSGPILPPLLAEVAQMNRIDYELVFTEGISQRMQIPETLQLASEKPAGPLPAQQPPRTQAALMQVPERIVVAGDGGNRLFPHPGDLDPVQSFQPVDILNMKAPPRVLTLTEQPLDSLETDQTASQQSSPSQAAHFLTRARRERSASEATPSRHSSQTARGDASVTPSPSTPPVRLCPPLCSPEDANLFTVAGLLSYVQSTTRRAYRQVLEVLEDGPRRTHLDLDLALDMTHDESGLLDASSLRRQVVRLNRRLQLLEEENRQRCRRELVLYSATVAFWMFNTWIWFRR